MNSKQYTVTQMSDIAGVSKPTISKWLTKRNIKPERIEGKRKYFNASYLDKYIRAHKKHDRKEIDLPTPTRLLLAQNAQLKNENEFLRKQADTALTNKSRESNYGFWGITSAIALVTIATVNLIAKDIRKDK